MTSKPLTSHYAGDGAGAASRVAIQRGITSGTAVYWHVPALSGLLPPSRHHPDQGALSFTALLRQDGGKGYSPPLDQQRLTAQNFSGIGHMCPLCPFNPFLVPDLDWPFCHPC